MWWFVELSAKYRDILSDSGLFLVLLAHLTCLIGMPKVCDPKKNIYKAISAGANNGIKTTGS
jgi:hypothetical protein